MQLRKQPRPQLTLYPPDPTDRLGVAWDAYHRGEVDFDELRRIQAEVLAERGGVCACGNAAAAVIDGRAVCPLCLDL